MRNMTDREFRTESIHAGQSPDASTGARAPPIHQTTSYVFPDAETAAERYALRGDGHLYSRISNPTVKMLEDRLATLGDGAGAVATASGLAALDALTLVTAKEGNNIVCATDVYGGTATYFKTIAARRGIEVRFVDTLDYDKFEKTVDADTAYVHVETIGNPSLKTPDFEALAEVAHNVQAPLVVDNTFATPAICCPLDHGADIVWSSTTKWIHGSGTTVGGIVIDGGDFEWNASKYEELAGESPAYTDIDFSEDFADAPLAAAVRYRSLRGLGNQQSPFDAWQTLQGIETLPVRMEKHCENALIVAEYLQDHPEVEWVSYPGLTSHPTHQNAEEYLDEYGSVVTFGLSGDGYKAGRKFCERTELASFLANIGDAKTVVIHPASTTHAQLSREEQREAGVQPDLIRLSVGIEDPADILADIDAGIDAATDRRYT